MTSTTPRDAQPSSSGTGAVSRPGRPRVHDDLTCPTCHQGFRGSPSQRAAVVAGRAAYCSRACQKAAGTETRPCAECSTPVTRQAARFRGDRAFCSDECRAQQSMKPRVRITVPCARCGEPAERTPSAAAAVGSVYCSRACKAAAQEGERVERPQVPCEQCGDVMVLEPDDVSHGKRYCSRECAGIARRRKPGERYVDKQGYAHITTTDGRSVREHVHVMEQVIGRPLVRGETPHHMNLVRDDNRPENLELWLTHQPSGARVDDLIPHWIEMLDRYADRLDVSQRAVLVTIATRGTLPA